MLHKQNTRMVNLSKQLQYSQLQAMPYRAFFGRNKAYQEEQAAKDKKKDEEKATSDGKNDKKTAAEEKKETPEEKKDKKPEAKDSKDAKTDKSSKIEGDENKEGQPESSSSSSSEPEDDTLSKEDIDKIKKLFNEQEAEIKSLEKTIAELEEGTLKQKKEINVIRIEYTKQVKENENTVKRYRKMIEDEKQFAISKFAKDLLEVRDAVRMGLEHTDIEKIKAIEDLTQLKEQFQASYEGSIMTAEVMDKVLERFKVTPYDPKGQKFDAELHEAVFTVAKSENENDTVEIVMQTGWKIGDRVLRAAKVGIVKK